MKIGTDAVLLGAWCQPQQYCDSILDVGAGTGVIALQLAQQTDVFTIDAVELEENAYLQTVENFERSHWADRLFCYHSSFQEFANEIAEEEETYDFIVSNPPFYNDDFETNDSARNAARFTSALSFVDLIEGVAKILSENGIFTVILPFKEESRFVEIAKKYGLYLSRVCQVKGTPESEVKRSLLEFSFEKKATKKELLIIETARHQYTQEYIELVKDFYLKM